jgi:hypothetical protein
VTTATGEKTVPELLGDLRAVRESVTTRTCTDVDDVMASAAPTAQQAIFAINDAAAELQAEEKAESHLLALCREALSDLGFDHPDRARALRAYEDQRAVVRRLQAMDSGLGIAHGRIMLLIDEAARG